MINGAEQAIQELWGLNDWWQGVTVATALLGKFVGAGGPFGDRLGRKRALAVIGALYLVSALGNALTASWGAFVAFRLLGGLGVGASSVVGPTYITEIAPAEKRGQMVALFQFNVVLGILMAYVSNFLLQGAGWRWMLGVEAVPAAAFLGLALMLPESPRWLAIRNAPAVNERILTPQLRFSVLLAIAFSVFNQVSSINAIIYSAPRIFSLSSLSESAGFLATMGVGGDAFLDGLLVALGNGLQPAEALAAGARESARIAGQRGAV